MKVYFYKKKTQSLWNLLNHKQLNIVVRTNNRYPTPNVCTIRRHKSVTVEGLAHKRCPRAPTKILMFLTSVRSVSLGFYDCYDTDVTR